MVYVPLDIVGDIIRQLVASYDENGSLEDTRARRKMLGACALVCHAWNPIASSYLFRDLSLSFRYHVPEVPASAGSLRAWTGTRRAFLENSNQLLPARTSDDLLALFSEMQAPCSYTKHLQLQGYASQERVLHEPDHLPRTYPIRYWLRTAKSMPAEALVSLINAFPNLRSISLLDIVVTYTGALDTVAHALDNVSIRYARAGNYLSYKPANAVEVLTCFGQVEYMEINFPDGKYDDERAGVPIAQLRPRALAFNDMRSDAHRLLAGLSARPAVYSSIREVTILNSCGMVLEGLVPFLRVLGPTLEVLRFPVHYTSKPKNTNLAFLTALRQMEFRLESLDLAYPDVVGTMLGYVASILRAGGITPQTSPQFDYIVLHLSVRSPYDRLMAQLPITEDERASRLADNVLDKRLASMFEQLHTFRLDVRYDIEGKEGMSHDSARSLIRAMFPLVQRKGPLQLSYVPVL